MNLWMQTGIYNVHIERIRHIYDQYGQRNIVLGVTSAKKKTSQKLNHVFTAVNTRCQKSRAISGGLFPASLFSVYSVREESFV